MLRDYFSFSGRLNRKRYWLRGLALFAVIVGFFLVVALGGGLVGTLASGDLAAFENFNPGAGLIVLGIVAVALFVAVTISGVSLAARRLHDRDRSAWWLVLFYVVPNFLTGDTGFFGPPDGGLATFVTLVGAAISIWGFVEIGILRGTDGPNRFGDDPLGEGPSAADVFA